MIKYSDKNNKKIKVCSVCGITSNEIDHMVSNKNKFKKELCNKHYRQLCREGKITNSKRPSTRKISDKNEYIYYNDYAEICLYNFDGDEIARTIIYLSDIEICKRHKWRLSDNGYVVTTDKRKTIYMHRFLMNPDKKMVIDHINKNKLDNRRCNLRICTQSQNLMNTSISTRNKFGAKGVLWIKDVEKWKATLYFNKKRIELGYYENIKDAIAARQKAEIEYCKEFVITNTVDIK